MITTLSQRWCHSMSRLQVEPAAAASNSARPHFIVGQDVHGWWLVIETHNLGGGLFKSREDALHFVDFETGHRADAVAYATSPLQLQF